MTIEEMRSSNNITTRYLRKEEYDLWDAFVDRSMEGTIFHKYIWLKAFARWQNLELRIVGCFKGIHLNGGMAFTCKKKFGVIKVMQIPIKTPFYSPVLADADTKYRSKIESKRRATLNALTDFLMSEIGMFTAIFPPSFKDIRSFIWKNFDTSIHYTYILELNSNTDLLECYDPPVRRQIKKGEQQAYTFQKKNSQENILLAQQLEQRSFQRQNLDLKYPVDESFTAFMNELDQEHSVQTYTILMDDKPAAAQIVILDQAKKMAYYWLAGAEQSLMSTGLNQLLLHLVLKDLQEHGIKGFDFVGAGTESIARYKSTFNFPLVSMHGVNKALGLAKAGLMIKRYL